MVLMELMHRTQYIVDFRISLKREKVKGVTWPDGVSSLLSFFITSCIAWLTVTYKNNMPREGSKIKVVTVVEATCILISACPIVGI